MRNRLIAGAGLLVLLTGCAHTSATSQGQNVHNLYGIILAMAAVVFVLVEGLLIYSIIRFRRRDDRPAPQILGSNRTLIAFFAFGAILVSILFPFGERALSAVLAPELPGESIRIEAFQWEWTAYYLNEGIFSTGKTLKNARKQRAVLLRSDVHVALGPFTSAPAPTAPRSIDARWRSSRPAARPPWAVRCSSPSGRGRSARWRSRRSVPRNRRRSSRGRRPT